MEAILFEYDYQGSICHKSTFSSELICDENDEFLIVLNLNSISTVREKYFEAFPEIDRILVRIVESRRNFFFR